MSMNTIVVFFSMFQEFEDAMMKLKKAYFKNATNFEAIKRGNIAFASDLVVCDDILKTVIHQTRANTNSTDKSQHKNTFLMRWLWQTTIGWFTFTRTYIIIFWIRYRSSAHTDLNTVLLEKKLNYTGTAHSDDLCYFF